MMSFSLCQEKKSSLQGRLFTKLKSYYIVAVKHIDSSLFQGNNSAEIPMAIRQTKTSLELPIFLNCWITSRVTIYTFLNCNKHM
jgi:hypothetical protein